MHYSKEMLINRINMQREEINKIEKENENAIKDARQKHLNDLKEFLKQLSPSVIYNFNKKTRSDFLKVVSCGKSFFDKRKLLKQFKDVDVVTLSLGELCFLNVEKYYPRTCKSDFKWEWRDYLEKNGIKGVNSEYMYVLIIPPASLQEYKDMLDELETELNCVIGAEIHVNFFDSREKLRGIFKKTNFHKTVVKWNIGQ